LSYRKKGVKSAIYNVPYCDNLVKIDPVYPEIALLKGLL